MSRQPYSVAVPSTEQGGYIPNPYGRDLGLGYRVRTPSSQEGDRGVEINIEVMAQLFGRDIKTIGKHINNALHEELASDPTGANFAIVQKEGGRLVTRQVYHR